MEHILQLIDKLYTKIESGELILDSDKVILELNDLKKILQNQQELDILLKLKLPDTNKSIFDNEKILLDLFTFDKKIFNLDNKDKCLIIHNQITDRLYKLQKDIMKTYPDLIPNYYNILRN